MRKTARRERKQARPAREICVRRDPIPALKLFGEHFYDAEDGSLITRGVVEVRCIVHGEGFSCGGYLRHIDDLILGAQETDSLLFLPRESDKPHSVLRDGKI